VTVPPDARTAPQGRLVAGVFVRLLAAAVVLACVAARPAAAGSDTIERRGGLSTLVGSILRYDEGALHVRTTSGLEVEVPWDEVRSVEAARPPADLRRLLERGDDLWRARIRLQRGAFGLAEEGFARHFDDLAAGDHRLSLLVAEGLLRCRIVRGDNAAAVVPMIHVVRLRTLGLGLPWDRELPPVIDEPTGLCPMLPPAFVGGSGLERALEEVEALRLVAPLPLGIARRYAAAIRRELGLPAAAPQTTPGDEAASAGLLLLDRMLAAAAGDDPMALAGPVQDARWREAWARLFVGLAAARAAVEGAADAEPPPSADPDAAVDRAVLELLHLPARFAADLPYAAGLALRRAAACLDAAGRAAEAERLRTDLRRRWAGHALAAPGAR